MRTRISEFEVSLHPVEVERLRQAAEKCVAWNPTVDPERFATEAHRMTVRLPTSVLDSLQAFRRHGSPTGGIVIHGLPVFEVPETPRSPLDAVGPQLTASGLLGIVAATLGDQIGFRPELDGQIIQDIVPVQGLEDTQRSVSSSTELYTHTELAFADDDFRADYIALFCLRADHDGVAGTTLSCVEAFLPVLSDGVVDILSQPRFKTTVDQSFLSGIGHDRPIWIGPIRVLTGSPDRPRLRADFAETVGIDSEAQDALDELREAAERVAVEIRLKVGDLLVVENHHAFHGRTPFVARWDGKDRWLLRTSIVRDLSRSAAHRPGDSPVVDVDYRAWDVEPMPAALSHRGSE